MKDKTIRKRNSTFTKNPLLGSGLETLRPKRQMDTPKKKRFARGGGVDDVDAGDDSSTNNSPSQISLLPTKNPVLANRRSFVDNSSPNLGSSSAMGGDAPPKKPSSTTSPTANEEFNLQDELKRSAKSLTDSSAKKKDIISNAISKLETRLADSQTQGMKPQDWFRLSAAFATPGHWTRGLAQAGSAGADILDKRESNQKELQDLITKYQLQGAETDVEHTKNLLGLHKELGGAESSYGKIAKDEGLKPGTPEFAARIKQLRAEELDIKRTKAAGAAGAAEGEFDRKTGNFITPGGSVIPKTEVSKDREARQKLIDQKASFAKIDKKTLNNAISPFDYTGAGATGSLGKAFAGTFKEDKLNAQTKIMAQAIEGIQKALPPGPASDKDVAQARATFPGFSSKKALNEWLKSLEDMVDRHITAQDQKYGSDKWFGAGGAPKTANREEGGGANRNSKSEGMNRNELGETPTEQKKMNKSKSKSDSYYD